MYRLAARLVMIAGVLFGFGVPAIAQVTTGVVSGTVQDSQGGVIPGATVVLISESRGTRGVPAVTNAAGDYVFPNTTADTYTVEVTMPGFRMTRRAGVPVSGGDRVTVPVLVIEPGGAEEIVNVTADAALIQAQSGERSFAVTSTMVEKLPLTGDRNFTLLTRMVPGVMPGPDGPSAGGTRLGGAGQNNIMMDGIGIVNTGNNGLMIPMNVDAIAEVKVLTQSYQAEYGRSSGLQITAVTKSGTNQFHGSVYDIEDNSDWATNSWQNQQNGVPKPVDRRRTWGYSLGGPAGRPGRANKLFFFYSHEYQPTTSSGSLNRFRVPTDLERIGNFSQSLDNNGAPIPQLRDPITREPYPNNVIPAHRLYAPGLAILNQYLMPNVQQTAPNAWNLEVARPEDKWLRHQPAVRLDYQFSPALRFTGKYAGQYDTERVVPGTMPGYDDFFYYRPASTWSATANYTLSQTTFLEVTYGYVQNRGLGPVGAGGISRNDAANRLYALADLPLIYPDAGWVDPRYYQVDALIYTGASFFDGTYANLTPLFRYGGLIGLQPPDHAYPTLNINRVDDVVVSLTKVTGRHTVKAGFFNQHSYKAQTVGSGGGGSFQGVLNFANSTNNPLDTGFGFANAATGVFTEYNQISRLIEGSVVYWNTEFYLQDNWRATNRLTLDYGMRFTRQQPQYDTLGQMSNFFPSLWSQREAPLLYVPGCSNGAVVCSGNVRNAMHPITGEILTAPGANNTASAIGTRVAHSGDAINGIRLAGDGISKYSYTWPALVFGPRFGMAYDLTGTQSLVLRGGVGLFYDRPDGNTVFSIPGNPPTAESQSLTNSQLQTLDQGLRTEGASNLVVFQYDAKVPSSVQWNAGVQMALPWASALDASYVGTYGYNRLAGFQGGAGTQVNLNQVNLGAAYLPENQDPTLGVSATAVPGSRAYTTNLLRPFRGYGTIGQQTTEFYDKYHSIQTSFNRRFQGGMSFGVNYTWSILFEGNTGLTWRLQHAPDGSFGLRDDQQAYEELNKKLSIQPHVLRGNVVWDLPDVRGDSGVQRVVAALVNDWSVSGVFNLSSGTNYDVTYSYQNNGNPVNLTGSPDFSNNGTGARIVFLGDPGSGCSSNQYAQFDTSVVTGPTYGSVGLESGRNRMRGCAQREVDLSLARSIRLGGGRALQLRADAFNAFNIVYFTQRQSQIQYNSPTDLTVRNSQFNEDGTIDPDRLRPQTAGFGAVTGAGSMRTIRVTFRLSF